MHEEQNQDEYQRQKQTHMFLHFQRVENVSEHFVSFIFKEMEIMILQLLKDLHSGEYFTCFR